PRSELEDVAVASAREQPARFHREPALDDARGLVAPVAIAQQTLVELARLLARELALEVEGVRALVVRELRLHELEELALEGGAGLVPVGGLHDAVHALTH